MRGSLTLKILEAVGGGIILAADIIAVVMESRHGSSYTELLKNFDIKQVNRRRREDIIAERAKVYVTLSRLKRQGFLEQKDKHWRLTILGKNKISKLKEHSLSALFPKKYQKVVSKDLVVIAFDVPERERQKRNWLRFVLRDLGFSMLQQSVWIGKVKLPKAFIKDLEGLNLLSSVEILGVTRSGTVQKL